MPVQGANYILSLQSKSKRNQADKLLVSRISLSRSVRIVKNK